VRAGDALSVPQAASPTPPPPPPEQTTSPQPPLPSSPNASPPAHYLRRNDGFAARVGEAQARVASMLLLTLRGTPTMYYGDELGIGRVEVQSKLVQDPWEKTEPGLGLGRDPWRTPFQWNNSTNAGFTKGRPWLPLDPDYRLRNAEELKKDPTSILCFYKQLIELRRHCRAVNSGTYRSIGVQGNIFAYERCNGDDRIIIALNMGMESQNVSAPLGITAASVLLSTHLDRLG